MEKQEKNVKSHNKYLYNSKIELNSSPNYYRHDVSICYH